MKCGLEIHQRLASGKLFCRCPSKFDQDAQADVSFTRKLHAVSGELGKIDSAAQAEAIKKKTFKYLAFNENTCLVELDEEPPHELDREALEAVLELCVHLKAHVVDEIHIMRKTVIDGSNTSGFQRTAIVGLNGVLETSKGKVGIPSICIEEESCGIIGEIDGNTTYRLDRLGIPLIEIATDPDIKDPEHALETAQKLGMLLRATGKVARGLGTIRQDVNVSTEEGARVEIKGAQELDAIPEIVKQEIKRQEELVKIQLELQKKFAGKIAFEKKIVDATPIFKNTKAKLFRFALDSGLHITAMKLPGFGGMLGREIGENRRFGSELSDYAKTAGVKGLVHSDENMEKYGVSAGEVSDLCKLLEVKEGDAWALVAAEKEVGVRALEQAYSRACMNEIPKETRKVLKENTTAYMRPLPGKARLYPETDLHPIEITQEMISHVKNNLSKSPEEQRAELERELGNKDLAAKLISGTNLALYRKLVKELKTDPVLVASTLEGTLVALKREGVPVENIPEEKITELFAAYEKNRLVKAAMQEALKAMAKEPNLSAEEAISSNKLGKITGNALVQLIKTEGNDFKALIAKYRLRVDAKELQEAISSAR